MPVRNDDIRMVLNLYALKKRTAVYKEKCKQHVNGIGYERFRRTNLNYNPRRGRGTETVV